MSEETLNIIPPESPFDFVKAKGEAEYVRFHADRVTSYAGDTAKGIRMAQPNAAWTMSELQQIVAGAMSICKAFDIDPLNPFGIEKNENKEQAKKNPNN